MDLAQLIAGARRSRFRRALLNTLLRWKIPFNQPHGLAVHPLPEGGIAVRVPYWRVNRNHIRGIHACCMATAAEYCSGLALLERLDAAKYRLIMKSIRVEYHYQAKTSVEARAVPTEQDVHERVIGPLATAEAVLYESVVELHDRNKAHVATAHITWQVKDWARVRTKV